MRFPLFAAGTIIGGLFMALPVAPAQAGMIHFEHGGIYIGKERHYDRKDAEHIARKNGMRRIDDIDRRGRDWVLRGRDRHWRPMRVIVDSRNGRATVLYDRHRRHHHDWHR